MNVNSYYTRPWILKRYLVGPLAAHLIPFSEFLARQGYSYSTGQRHVREVGHMSRWLERQGIDVADLGEETIRTYLCFRYSSAHLSIKKGPYRQILKYLRQTGTITTQIAEETPLNQCIARYQEQMVKNQGLADLIDLFGKNERILQHT